MEHYELATRGAFNWKKSQFKRMVILGSRILGLSGVKLDVKVLVGKKCLVHRLMLASVFITTKTIARTYAIL